MAEIFDFHVQDDRSILIPQNRHLEPIMQEDHKVATWRFRIPKVLNNIDMTAWSWWFVCVNAKGQEFSELLTLTDDIDEPASYSTADYDIDYGISKFPGSFSFALEAINTSQGGEISGEWHTRTYSHKVDKTLQGNQAEYAETESDIISALIVEVQNKYNTLVGGATPLVVSSVSAMTDTSKIYVLSTDGNWYYYNGSAWVSGGTYASGITIDPTLTQSGQAADAKVVGDALEDIDSYTKTTAPTLWEAGGISYTNGANASTSQRIRSAGYIDKNVLALTLTDKRYATGYKTGVYAYENGTYIGMLNTAGEFAKRTVWLDDIDFVALRETYPTYDFRIVGSRQNDATIDFTAVDYYLFKKSLYVEKDRVFYSSTNLFDYDSAVFGQINTTTGAVTSSTNNKISALIAIKPSTKYTYNQSYTRIAWYTAHHEFIQSDYSDSAAVYTVESPSNAAFCRLITNAGKTPILRLNEGETLLAFEPYFKSKIVPDYLPNVSKKYAFSAMAVPSLPEPITYGAVSDNLTVSQIYGWYDTLAEEYPAYISKHDWGMDASNTYHIYSYSLHPEALEDDDYSFADARPYPKMLIRGGCHGYGANGDHHCMIYALHNLVYDICHNSAQNDLLYYLRHNINLEILPLMNPWGVQNRSRKNSNDIDINRNFPYGWGLETASSADYGGTAPLSESESLAIKAFVEANTDAFCDIEFHAVSREYQTQPHMMYFDTVVNSEMYYVNRSVIAELTKKWKSENHAGLTDIPYYGYVDGTNGQGQVTAWITHIGIPSTIMEGFVNYEGSSYITNSVEIEKMCADEINCMILSAIRYFAKG